MYLRTETDRWQVAGGLSAALIEARAHTLQTRERCYVHGDDDGLICAFVWSEPDNGTEPAVLLQCFDVGCPVVFRAFPVDVNQFELFR